MSIYRNATFAFLAQNPSSRQRDLQSGSPFRGLRYVGIIYPTGSSRVPELDSRGTSQRRNAVLQLNKNPLSQHRELRR